MAVTTSKRKEPFHIDFTTSVDITNVPTCRIVVLRSMWLHHKFLQWVGLEGVWHLGRVGWQVDPCLQNAPSEDNNDKQS